MDASNDWNSSLFARGSALSLVTQVERQLSAQTFPRKLAPHDNTAAVIPGNSLPFGNGECRDLPVQFFPLGAGRW
jgi:hypothetical protein